MLLLKQRKESDRSEKRKQAKYTYRDFSAPSHKNQFRRKQMRNRARRKRIKKKEKIHWGEKKENYVDITDGI